MSCRVALVVPAFPKVSETFIVSKFLGLLDRGWDVHVVCGRSEKGDWAHFSQLSAAGTARARIHVAWRDTPRWKAALLAPLAVLRCLQTAPLRTLRYVRRGLPQFGVLGTIGRLYLDADLVKLGPDIVHFEFGALAPARMYLSELLDCRVIVSFRGYDLNTVALDQPKHYETVWSKAAGLHLLGEDLWRRARRRGCPPEIFHVLIAPAIDPEFFQPDPQPSSEPDDVTPPLRILSVGRFDWRKGYEDALLAVRQLIDRGVACRYRIVGDGEYLGAVAFVRHQLDLEGVVEFLGARSREDVRREMQGADVLLHAAVSEGFCNAVMEAQAMELPVVCTDAGGLPENVADGESGFVVPRRDPATLAAKLEVFARDPDLRRRMGKAGRRRVLEKFQLSDQLDRFERFYEQVLEGARPAGRRAERVEEPMTAVGGGTGP